MSLAVLHTYLIPPKTVTPVHRSVPLHSGHRGRGNNAGGGEPNSEKFRGTNMNKELFTPTSEPPCPASGFDTYWMRAPVAHVQMESPDFGRGSGSKCEVPKALGGGLEETRVRTVAGAEDTNNATAGGGVPSAPAPFDNYGLKSATGNCVFQNVPAGASTRACQEQREKYAPATLHAGGCALGAKPWTDKCLPGSGPESGKPRGCRLPGATPGRQHICKLARAGHTPHSIVTLRAGCEGCNLIGRLPGDKETHPLAPGDNREVDVYA